MPKNPTLIDLSSPNLVDLLDELIRNTTTEPATITTSVTAQDLGRIPIQRGLAAVERFGVRLVLTDQQTLDLLLASYPDINAGVYAQEDPKT